jgi:hypothetical protein
LGSSMATLATLIHLIPVDCCNGIT